MKNTLLDIQIIKKELDGYRHFPKEIIAKLDEVFKLEFTYTSNSLDGSTLSKSETAFVIEKGIAIGGRTLQEQNNAVMYSQTVDWIRQSAQLSKYDITENFLLSLHHLPSVTENRANSALKYSFQVPYVLSEYIEWLHQYQGSDVETAVEAHNKLIASKVFSSGAARTARLLMNLLLIQKGYPLVYIEPREQDLYRSTVAALENGSSEDQINELMYGAVARSLMRYLKALKEQKRTPDQQLLKIGELAKLTNETIPTLRHWTKQGLLEVADHTQGGYQLYSPEVAEVVIKIRELQRGERRTVKEIKKILSQPL